MTITTNECNEQTNKGQEYSDMRLHIFKDKTKLIV